MVKAVIFDMDGVLVDTEPIYMEIEKRFFEKLGVIVDLEDHGQYAGMTSYGMWEAVKERYGLSESVENLVNDSRKQYLEELKARDLQAIKGIPQLVGNLKERGIKLAVATSGSRKRMELIIGKIGLGDFFDGMVCADDVEKGKPDPEIYLKAAEVVGVVPSECMAIEDTSNGILAAKAAGMAVIGIRTNPVKQDFSKADRVIEEFNALEI